MDDKIIIHDKNWIMDFWMMDHDKNDVFRRFQGFGGVPLNFLTAPRALAATASPEGHDLPLRLRNQDPTVAKLKDKS